MWKITDKKSKKIIISVFAILIAVIVGIGVYGYSYFNKIDRDTTPKTNEEFAVSEKPKDLTPAEERKYNDVENIAFFGLDPKKPGEPLRADTIMVVSVDKTTKEVKVTSLLRDMYLDIPGKGKEILNHAYSIGGPQLAIKTINSNFGLNIKDYVSVDLYGLEKLIDKFGGVEIDVKPQEIEYINISVMEFAARKNDSNKKLVTEPGLQVLNGRQAVGYIRIRKVGTDFERTARQRKVLDKLFKKVKEQGALKLPQTISMVLPYIKTNLKNGQMLELAKITLKFDVNKIKQFRVPVNGSYHQERVKNMDVLKFNLQLNKKKLFKFIYE